MKVFFALPLLLLLIVAVVAVFVAVLVYALKNPRVLLAVAGAIGVVLLLFFLLAVGWYSTASFESSRVAGEQHPATEERRDAIAERRAKVAAAPRTDLVEFAETAEQPADEDAFAEDPQPSTDPKRPAWVDTQPGLVDGVYRQVVTAGPHKTLEDCQQELDEKLQEAVEEQTARMFGPQPPVSLAPAEIRRSVVKQQWQETVVSRTPAVGSMIQLHVLLGFDRQANALIEEARNQAIVTQRMWWSGIGLGAVLLLLSVAYTYLKADLAAGGAYRWRLRLAAAVMILGVVAAALAAVTA